MPLRGFSVHFIMMGGPLLTGDPSAALIVSEWWKAECLLFVTKGG